MCVILVLSSGVLSVVVVWLVLYLLFGYGGLLVWLKWCDDGIFVICCVDVYFDVLLCKLLLVVDFGLLMMVFKVSLVLLFV